MIIKVAKHTARTCLTLMGVLLILLAVLTMLARVGLPLASSYKGNLESHVSDYLRSPVDIGKLSLSWEGFGPLLRAQDVAVYESEERQVTLDELLIDLNLAKSLLRGIPVINELTLVGASLAIEADKQGQLRLHGMESVSAQPPVAAGKTRTANGGVDIVAWLLTAKKVGLLDTKVTLIDMRADRRLVMEDLNIRAENTGDVHKLRIDLRLPEELGGSLEAGIDLVGQANNLLGSDGNVYLKADALQVQTFSELLSLSQLLDIDRNLLSHIDTGVSLEMWGQWRDGKLVSARGPVSTGAIVDTVGKETVLDGLSAIVELTQGEGVSTLEAKKIKLALGSAAADIDLIRFSRDSADSKATWPAIQAQGSELPLELLARLPISLLARIRPDQAARIRESRVQGRLLNWQLDMAPSAGQASISASADLDNLSSQASGALPGIGPLSGRVNIDQSIGQLSFASNSMPVAWPALTDESLNIDSLKVAMDIDIRDLQNVLIESDIALLDNGIETSTRIKARLAAGQSPHLDIQSRYSAADVRELKPWLPRKKMAAASVRWLDRAIEKGKAENGSLLFFGNLSEFPFDDGEGVFRASVNIEQGQLAFLPTWPSVSGIDSTLELSGLTLTGFAGPASLASFDVSQSSFRIDDLAAPVLHVNGTADGTLQEILDFGNNGPLKKFLQPALNDVSGTGAAQMDIALTVPLYKKPAVLTGKQLVSGSEGASIPVSSRSKWLPFAVDGSLFLSDNDLSFGRAQLDLEQANGAIGFNRYGIRINNLQGRVLGQPVSLNGRTRGVGAAGQTTVNITGALKASDVLAHYSNPLDQFFRGASSWNVDVVVPHSSQRIAREGVSLTFSSDLVGTQLLLPAPMGKSSGQAQPIVLNAAFYDEPGKAQWKLQIDGNLQAHVKMESGELFSLLVNFDKQEIAQSIIDSNPAGIRIQGNVASLAADGWVDSISRFVIATSDPDAEPKRILPISSNLSIGSLILGDRSLGSARLRANTDSTFVNIAFSNQAIHGNLRYPREYWKKDTTLKARLARVDWSLIEALKSESSTELPGEATGSLDPRLLPPIDARISAITRNSLTIKDVVLRAQPDVSGLNVTTLGFAYKTMQLVGQGYWHVLDPQGVNADLTGQHLTRLNMVLQSDDFGSGLVEVGLDDVLSDGEGTVELQVSWPGPAYKPELAQLDGRLKLQLERGSIVPLEPAGGRVVGLFALQALPRRLELDFKDITDEGLAFKRITGDISIEDGVADASLIQLTGPIGVVDVTGSSDLNTQQFDQRITVLPRVSAALPIIGVISGGASAGVGALVAAGFLKALGIDIDRIGLRDYSLTGSWDEPLFKSVPADYGRRR